MTGSIEVAAIRTEVPSWVQESCVSLLDAEELNRLRRFHRQCDREQFAIVHGVLRVLIADRLNLDDPRNLTFKRGSHGKPYIPDCDLRFNLSHSGQYVVIAMALNLEVGIDVQAIDDRCEIDGIVRRYFHRDEMADLSGLEPDRKRLAFFEYWARKEACAKALGMGLWMPLNSFSTSSRSQSPSWVIHDLAVALGYAAALAYQGVPRSIVQLPTRGAEDVLSSYAIPARYRASWKESA